MKRILLVVPLLMIVLTACLFPDQQSTPLLLNSRWRLVNLNGKEITTEPPITLRFKNGDTITGSDGCNGYSARLKLRHDDFMFDDVFNVHELAVGAKGYPNDELKARAKEFYDTLLKVRRRRMIDKRFYFYDQNDHIILIFDLAEIVE